MFCGLKLGYILTILICIVIVFTVTGCVKRSAYRIFIKLSNELETRLSEAILPNESAAKVVRNINKN